MAVKSHYNWLLSRWFGLILLKYVPTMCSIKYGSSCFYYGSSVRDQTSFVSTSNTVSSIEWTNTQFNNWFGSNAPMNNWALQTCPFSSFQTSITLACLHSFPLGISFRITVSPTLTCLLESSHFCLLCNVAKNSLHHPLQNLLLMCCTCLQHFLQYRSFVPHTPGGGTTTLDFIVRRWLGGIVTSLFA